LREPVDDHLVDGVVGQPLRGEAAVEDAQAGGQALLRREVAQGVERVRGGVGTALVGSNDEVADRIAEYHAIGFDEFILSGYPHLEEAYWFGEGVMPRLRDRGLLADVETGPAPVFSFR